MLGFRSAWRDIENYRAWISTVKAEFANPDSQFNKFGFSHNYTYMIYLVMALETDEGQLPDNLRRLRVIEKLRPVNRYLDEDLNFAEYLVPEFNQVYDDDEPTLNYVIAYRFAFKTLGVWWIIKRSILIGGLIFLGFRAPWQAVYETISSWISALT